MIKIIVGLFVYFVFGFLVMILDQSIEPNEEGKTVIIWWVVWPLLATGYLVGYILQVLEKVGNKITLWGAKINHHRNMRYSQKEADKNES